MERRTFLATLAGSVLVAPLAAKAQQVKAIPVIGELAVRADLLQAFHEGLRDLGYVEGTNVAFEYRPTDQLEQLPQLAAELAQRKVNLFFAPSTPAATAARKASDAIPIVFATVADPIGAKLVTTLARPGGNATGLTRVRRPRWSPVVCRELS